MAGPRFPPGKSLLARWSGTNVSEASLVDSVGKSGDHHAVLEIPSLFEWDGSYRGFVYTLACSTKKTVKCIDAIPFTRNYRLGISETQAYKWLKLLCRMLRHPQERKCRQGLGDHLTYTDEPRPLLGRSS